MEQEGNKFTNWMKENKNGIIAGVYGGVCVFVAYKVGHYLGFKDGYTEYCGRADTLIKDGFLSFTDPTTGKIISLDECTKLAKEFYK